MLIVKKTLLTMLIGLVLAGCSAVPSQTPTIYQASPSQTPTLYPADSSNSLLNTYWNLVLLQGQPLAKGTSIVLRFSDKNINGGSEATIYGHAGCNWYRGPYHANDQQIRLENFQITAMECVGNTDVMAQEKTYTDLLNSAVVSKIADYRINSAGGQTQLVILDGNGQPVLVYAAISQGRFQDLYNSPPSPQASATSTPAAPTPTPAEAMSATSLPSQTPQETPTQAAKQMTPSFVTGPSETPWFWSPDSRWLPYIDFNAQTLHFYDVSNASICDFPSPIHYTGPDHFMAWLPDGRVVVQAADKVMAGLPCGTFVPATPQEMLVLDHSDPSFSPDGRYQVETQFLNDSTQGPNSLLTLREVSTGKVEAQTNFQQMAGKSLPGFWVDTSHYLIDDSGDQGPLLLSPGEPVVQVAKDIFHLPLKPASGEYNDWLARTDVVDKNVSHFHLILIPSFVTYNLNASNPLQIYHSETGQVETLPYLISQGAFSSDGHWLLVSTHTDQGDRVLIRPVDPPGSAFQPFSDQPLPPTWWSPDGSLYAQVSEDLATLTVYSTPDRTILGVWRAAGYGGLSPSWSPDSKYLSVGGGKQNDNQRGAIFVIRVSTP